MKKPTYLDLIQQEAHEVVVNESYNVAGSRLIVTRFGDEHCGLLSVEPFVFELLQHGNAGNEPMMAAARRNLAPAIYADVLDLIHEISSPLFGERCFPRNPSAQMAFVVKVIMALSFYPDLDSDMSGGSS